MALASKTVLTPKNPVSIVGALKKIDLGLKPLLMESCMKRCLFLVLLLIAPFASAQNSHGSITGQVTDPSGAIIPKAQVTVTNIDTGYTTNVIAGSSGFYTAPELPPGPYKVAVQ